jgi:hypothetical protein
MTDAPSEPAGDTKPHVWFPDTGALVTLAVHPPLQRAVVATLSAHDRVLAFSVHKLLHQMIKQRRITAVQAAGFADALHSARRAQDYTAAELASGRLGRVGQP